MFALSALLLSRAYVFLAFWSFAKFLQAASFDSRACRGDRNKNKKMKERRGLSASSCDVEEEEGKHLKGETHPDFPE